MVKQSLVIHLIYALVMVSVIVGVDVFFFRGHGWSGCW